MVAAICVILLTLLTVNTVNAEDSFLPIYSAQGVFRYAQRYDQRVIEPEYWNYEVSVDSLKHWKIIIHARPVVNGLTIISDTTTVYDGTNIYSLTSGDVIKVDPTNPTHFEKVNVKNPVQVANICVGPYPLDSSSAVGIIWLAYIAGENLDPEISKVKFPNLSVSDARMDPMAWSCDFNYELVQSSKYKIVKSGKYIVNPLYIKPHFSDYLELDEPSNGGADDRQMFYKYDYLRNITNEQVAAVYTLDVATNLSGIVIPTVFHLEINTDTIGFGTNGYSIFDGVITKIQATTNQSLFPMLGEDVTVRDRRLRIKTMGSSSYRKEVVYKISDGIWPISTNDARVQAAIDPKAGWRFIYSESRKITHRNPKYVRLIVIIMFFLPIGYIVSKYMIRRKLT
jgi:hypothetical protein